MDAQTFKQRADAIEEKAQAELAEARKWFEEKREKVERKRRDDLADLADEYRRSLDDKGEGEAIVDGCQPEAPAELPVSKSGRLKRGVLDEILPGLAREIDKSFTKTMLHERAAERYPHSPINRTSVNGAVDRLEEKGVLKKIADEPEQMFILPEWEAGADKNPRRNSGGDRQLTSAVG